MASSNSLTSSVEERPSGVHFVHDDDDDDDDVLYSASRPHHNDTLNAHDRGTRSVLVPGVENGFLGTLGDPIRGQQLLNLDLSEASRTSETSYLSKNSEKTIDFEARRFVLTDALGDIIEVLNDKGVVVLTGDPGCGKTYLGYAVLRYYRDLGYTPYTLRSFTDWDSHVGPDTRSVVLLDRTLGRHRVNSAEYELWLALRSTVIALTAQDHCKLVIIVYPHVLCALQKLEKETRKPLLDSSVVISLPGSLDRHFKEGVLFVHLQDLNLPEDKKRWVVEEVLQKDVSGAVFPWCCDWMVQHWLSTQNPTDIFTRPADAYVPLLCRMLQDEECGEKIGAVLVLAMRGQGDFLHDPSRVVVELKDFHFRGNLSSYRLKEQADLLKGFILKKDGYDFKSRILYDAAGLALMREYTASVLLQVCDVRFLIKYIIINPQLCHQLLKMMSTEAQKHRTKLELVVLCLLFACSREMRHTVKPLLKELVHMRFEGQIKYRWPIEEDTSSSSQKSSKRLQTQGACYLDNPSNCISKYLLTVRLQENVVMVDLAGQHLYLVLRLLTDTERDEQDDDGNTVFHLAAFARLWNILEMADETSVEVKNKNNVTPVQLLQTLWHQTGDTPLHWAAKGSIVFVRALIQHGANVNEKDVSNGKTALHMTCWMCNNTDLIIPELLKHNADVNAKDNKGVTPLHVASKNLDKNTVIVLAEHADVNVKDNAGNTPLHWAAEYGNIDCVRALIQLHAIVDEKNTRGETALHKTCKIKQPGLWAKKSSQKFSATETVSELLRRGADVIVQDNHGSMPIHYASRYWTKDEVLPLLEKYANVNVKDNEDNTPLHWAAEYGNIDCIRALIQLHAIVDEKNTRGETALHKACKMKRPGLLEDTQKFTAMVLETVSELLRHGADVIVQDNNGNTPLHYASRYWTKDEVRPLLEKQDAVVNIKNNDGKTPLDLATEHDNTETADLLAQIGASEPSA